MFDNLFGGGKKPAGSPDKPQGAGKPAIAPLQPLKPKDAGAPGSGLRAPTSGAGLRAPSAGSRPAAPVGTGAQPGGAPAPSAAPAQPAVTDFQAVVDEAAIVFASGDEKNAAEMLLKCLSESKGSATQRVWYMLLDIYHASGKKDRFEQLGLHFAKRFGTSPPSWDDVGSGAPEPTPGDEPKKSGGRNLLLLEGALMAGVIQNKGREFLVAARELRVCKIDVSRVKPDPSEPEGFGALQQVMGQLRKYKIGSTLMGEVALADWLKNKIMATKEEKKQETSPWWLLLLEILQWRGKMEEFEELSFEYTMTFEVSGPGWDPNGLMTIEAADDSHHEPVAASTSEFRGIVPDEVITEASIGKLQEAINLRLKEKGDVVINMKGVKRMDFSAAGAFMGMVASLNLDPKKVFIAEPSELLSALMDVVGVSIMVTIAPRKR